MDVVSIHAAPKRQPDHFIMGSEEFFEGKAPAWDAMLCDAEAFVNHQESFRRFHWFLKRALKIGNRQRSFRLLDLGCGTGEAAWPLWKRVQTVTFFDRSAAMLRLARNKYPKGVFVRGDARSLPFLDNEFDVIVSRGCVLSMMEPEEARACLESVQRVARDGAYVLFDFKTPTEWPNVPDIFKTPMVRSGVELLISAAMPEAEIIAYDGTQAHAVNRVLVRIKKS